MNRGFVLDGVELLYHLRQTPCAKAGQDDNAEQVERVGTKERSKDARLRRGCRIGNLCQTVDRFHKAALAHQHSGNDNRNAKQHDDALNKVIDGGCHVAACDDVNRGQNRHENDTDGVVNVECHAEQAG